MIRSCSTYSGVMTYGRTCHVGRCLPGETVGVVVTIDGLVEITYRAVLFATHARPNPAFDRSDAGSDQTERMLAGPRSATLVQPMRAMVRLISDSKLFNTWSTPSSPAAPNPYR